MFVNLSLSKIMFSSYPNRRKMIKRIIFWTIIISALLAFFVPNLVRALAVDVTKDPCVEFGTCIAGLETKPNGDTGQIASDLILQVASILAYICGSLAVLFIIKSAWDIMSAGGDSAKYQKAVTGIGYAIGGLFIIAASWGLVATILNMLNTVRIG